MKHDKCCKAICDVLCWMTERTRTGDEGATCRRAVIGGFGFVSDLLVG